MQQALHEPCYALDLNSEHIGIGSFHTKSTNFISIYDHSFNLLHKFASLEYPITQLRFNPGSSLLFATTSDYFRLHNIDGTIVHKFRNYRRVNSQTQELCAPLTAFDWNIFDPNNCITASLDTTCTVWDLNEQKAKVQLIAHDKEIHDVKYGGDTNTFGTVSLDGSLRIFDLRQLQHSTILFESRNNLPLLKFSWSRVATNMLATFLNDTVIILDTRVPAVPVYELKNHVANVSQVEWHDSKSNTVISSGDDGQVMMWDVNKPRGEISSPASSFGADDAVSNFKIHGGKAAVLTNSMLYLINS